jgi:hypothetical protein
VTPECEWLHRHSLWTPVSGNMTGRGST